MHQPKVKLKTDKVRSVLGRSCMHNRAFMAPPSTPKVGGSWQAGVELIPRSRPIILKGAFTRKWTSSASHILGAAKPPTKACCC